MPHEELMLKLELTNKDTQAIMDSKAVFEFLRTHYLFSSLSDDELGQLLPLFQPITLEPEEVLYREGFPARNFFLIMEGAIHLTDPSGSSRMIRIREHFGGTDLLKNALRTNTAKAKEHTELAAVNKRGFEAILKAYPELKSKLQAVNKSRILQKNYPFPWLGDDEYLRFISRKHLNTFYGRLGFPVLFLIAALVLSFLLGFNRWIFLPITGILFGGWVYWYWLDWGNDFYLVSNQRVAWVEKVLWLHDQRREVPLQSVLSVNKSTNQIQRIFGYGDVIIRTYTGNMPMRNSAYPQVLLEIILETQQLAKEKAKHSEISQIGETIRTRLGMQDNELSPEGNLDDSLPAGIPASPQLTETITPLQEFLNLFRARYELDGVINYRKHKFILLRNSWWLWMALVFETAAVFARLVNLISIPSFTILAVLTGATLMGLGYVFADWANDRFQITDQQIIDLDRSPFGRETKRSALLENILSLDYSRENIVQRLFDFGTVAINVGDIRLDFEDVAHPKSVQNEIFERYNGAIKRLEAEESQRRRDDMVEFLAAYHEESQSDPDQTTKLSSPPE